VPTVDSLEIALLPKVLDGFGASDKLRKLAKILNRLYQGAWRLTHGPSLLLDEVIPPSASETGRTSVRPEARWY
jgi:hypothetical protein